MEKQNKIYFNPDKNEYNNFMRNYYTIINLYKNRGISLELTKLVLEEQKRNLLNFIHSIKDNLIINKSRGLIKQMEKTLTDLELGVIEQNS